MKYFGVAMLVLLFMSGCAKSSEEVGMEDIRKPAVAGSWYPGDPDSLRAMIEAFIEKADVPKIDGRIFCLIAPHAGYIYSGPVAAYAFKALLQRKDEYKGNTVILVGFSHRPPSWSGISVWAKGFWETPLGRVKVDEELAQRIISLAPNTIQYRREVHYGEHSLEMELPFLQYVLDNDLKIVPIAFSHQTQAEIETLTSALLSADIDWGRTFVVVSTDMSHYLPYDRAVSVDKRTLDYVLSGDIDGLSSWIPSAGAFCGWAGVLVAMRVASSLGATKAILLKYANSGDTQPQTAAHGVVGYCAVAFVMGDGRGTSSGEGGGGSAEALPGTQEYSLTRDQKLYLLRLARTTIEKYVHDGVVYEPPKPDDPKLVEDAPVFVTLHRKGMLRGCIGQMVAQEPLYLAVRDMAIAAATKDYRFPPVQPNEIDEIDIEISVLSPLRRISSWEEIKPFKHGVYVKRGWQSGVFLPQVWGQIPDKEAFLRELCVQKAHLEPECYKDPKTELYVYTVLEFSEKELGLK